MSKYDNFSPRARGPARPWSIHPVWRGIGCIMMILIPVVAYAGAVLLVQENVKQGWLPVPIEFARAIDLPYLGTQPYLLANLLVALVLSLIGFGIFTMFYSFLYQLMGPSNLGPLDAPPVRQRERDLEVARKRAIEEKRRKWGR
jgi:hypothetical protein